MDPIMMFALRLAIAAAASWILLLFIRKILGAINVATKGVFFEKTKLLGAALDFLMPVLPCIPSGFLFWLAEHYSPTGVMLDGWVYQVCAGVVAGSFAANLYTILKRWLEKATGTPGGTPPTVEPPSSPDDTKRDLPPASTEISASPSSPSRAKSVLGKLVL